MPNPSYARVHPHALALAAASGALWVFVLVSLGAFTTSIGAGMAFPDWPLSNGSLNPTGWLTDLAMFAEHSHRLSAAAMTGISLVLLVWIRRVEPRRWVRHLAGWTLALVFAQALLGGLRVLLERHTIAELETTLGRLFAMAHAGLAQVFVCAVLALAVGVSHRWATAPLEEYSPKTRHWGLVCCALLLVQLAVAAVMRHSFAGLAIPSFPWSNPEGGVLPAAWDFRVGIHFAHRLLALVLVCALPFFVTKLRGDPAAGSGIRRLGALVVALLAAQIALGAASVLTHRSPQITTAHVFVGALLLAGTFLLTLLAHRARIESTAAPAAHPVQREPAASLTP
ncbi:MAG TPA: COX15/CtaA family protein [Opitutaceae bacterium]|nr:COX15/CtaA family protein [Opitutaceae bacterium]